MAVVLVLVPTVAVGVANANAVSNTCQTVHACWRQALENRMPAWLDRQKVFTSEKIVHRYWNSDGKECVMAQGQQLKDTQHYPHGFAQKVQFNLNISCNCIFERAQADV